MKPNETHKLTLIRIRVAMLAYAIDTVSFQEHARNLRRNRPRGPSRGIWCLCWALHHGSCYHR